LYDASFIISALATFGLITFSPAVEHLLRFVPERFELRAIATSTLCVQLFSLPALLYFTGNLSLLSVPANMLALPALPWVMLGGFVSGAFGLLSPVLALAPAAAAEALLHWILFIVGVVSKIPYASATVVAFPLWAALLCYAPLVALAIYSYRKNVSRLQTS
jgi:competence protein ComEC